MQKALSIIAADATVAHCKGGPEKVGDIDPHTRSEFRYAIEFRHKSWFDKSVYKLLSDNNICLAWSQLDNIQTLLN